MIKLYTLLISFFVLTAQDVSLSAYVEKNTVEDNKTFKLFLEFTWQGEATDYRVQLKGLPTVYGLEVLGSGSTNRVGGNEQNPTVTRKYFYNLKPTRVGKAAVEAIRATVVNSQTSESFELTSQSIDLVVVKGKEETSIDSQLIYIGIGVLVLLALAIVFVMRRANAKKAALAAFAVDDSLVENHAIKTLTMLKNDPDRLEETCKKFFNLYESYLAEAHINKDSILIDEAKSDELGVGDFKSRLDEIRFSGINPDVYEMEKIIDQFKKIVEENLNTRNKRSAAQ